MASRVSVVGVGNMGLAIALRLRDRGHEVLVRDVRPEREAMAEGCSVCTSAADAARRTQLCIVVVVDEAQTDDVLFGAEGLVHGAAPGDTVMLCPTISVAAAERFANRLQALGIEVLDAPMSGGPERARQGTMSLMVACSEGLLARWRTLLDDMASPVFHIGTRPGDGARTKLVNNLLAAVNWAGAAEALALAERLGLDARRTLAVIERSSGQSWIGSDRARRALAGDQRVRAHVGPLAKDSRLALAEAAAAGCETPVGESAAARFEHALQCGLAGADDGVLLELARTAAQPSALAAAALSGAAPVPGSAG